MTVNDFQQLINNALSNCEEILHILETDHSLLVSCTDDSGFYMDILESKQTFVHDAHKDKFAEEYLATHTKEEFAKDVLEMSANRPGFFLYFMIFSRLEEMQIIDRGLFYHIMDSIIHYESEIDGFVARVLRHYNVKK